MIKNGKYTCSDYREEMMLLGLKRRLENQDLPEEERRIILEKVQCLEYEMDLD